MPLLYEQLRNYLLEEIQSGRLKPGDRVPSESELSAQFGVSRITSKKALETLQTEGVVLRSRGRGTFVADSPAVANGYTFDRFGPNITSAPVEQNVRRIGFIVPDVSEYFGLRLLHAIETRVSEYGYQFLLRRTMGQRQSEIEAISQFAGTGVAGVVIFPVHGEYYNDELLRVVLNGYPVVLVDRYLRGIAVSSVCTDNYAASKAIATVLIQQGHKQLAFFSPPPERTTSIEDRRRGFSAALREHGLPVDSDHFLMSLSSTLPGTKFADVSPDDSVRIREYLQAHPEITAIVACEYTLALLANREALKAQKSQDLIISCFDSPEDPFDEYRFLHIRQDEWAMGYAAVDALVAHIEHGAQPAKQFVDFSLIIT
jgi:DNA-binding LacI/PurR family transcriptional regulator